MLEAGARHRVLAIVTSEDLCPADDFLASLRDRAQAQFKARFEAYAAVGHLRAPEFYRVLRPAGEPTVAEIKIHDGPGYRLYVIRQGLNLVATHGGAKPKKNRVSREVELARAMYKEWT